MEKMPSYQPSEVELEILQILWEHQPTTVRFVHEMIQDLREVSYTTVLTVLQRMTKKGLVERVKKGKTHYYRAVPKEVEIQENLLQRLLNTAFKGSTMKMVMHALGQSKASEEELTQIQEWLTDKKEQKND